MADIPWELFTIILSLLPVESILRFRSMSKSIRTLIDSHYFINLHLQNSLKFNFILLRNYSDFYRMDFPNLTSSFKVNLPIKLYNKGIELLGSCNGVICISNRVNQFAFWNPITGKRQILLYLHIPLQYGCREFGTVHGFVFDQLACDYKLVSISLFYDRQDHTYFTQVRLFSSKTNSWRMLPRMPPYNLCKTPVFVDNCLHWIQFQNPGQIQHYLIVAFNLKREILNEVPLPEIGVAANKRGLIIDVSLLGECLCMTVNYSVYYQTTKSDVWVMKEYGVRDSWCKLFTLEEWNFNAPLTSLKPLGYSSSDRSKVLLEVDRKKLFWYDINREIVTSVLGIPNFNEAMICVESLLPPFDSYDVVRRTNRSCNAKEKGREGTSYSLII